MSYPYRDQDGLTGEQAAQRAITQMEKQIGADSLAAIIIEPIQGEGGFIVPAEGFLPTLVAWARANGVVFIADEVQTGFSRTGAWFACEHEDVVPDIITMAKGMAGGMPSPQSRDGPNFSTRSTPADSAAPTAAIPSPVPPRSPPSTPCGRSTCRAGLGTSPTSSCRGCTPSPPRSV